MNIINKRSSFLLALSIFIVSTQCMENQNKRKFDEINNQIVQNEETVKKRKKLIDTYKPYDDDEDDTDISDEKILNRMLIQAINSNNTKLAQEIISTNIDVNRQFKNEEDPEHIRAPLHAAVCQHNLFFLELLIKNGATNLDLLDSSDQTPLYVAYAQGYLESFIFLLENGANPNMKDSHEETVLISIINEYLSSFSDRDFAVKYVKLLLSHNANIYLLPEITNVECSPEKYKRFDNIIKQAAILKKNATNDIITLKNTPIPKYALFTFYMQNQNKSVFNNSELLTLALLNSDHNDEKPKIHQFIQSIINRKIFTPIEIVEGIILRQTMPVEIMIGNILMQLDDGAQKNITSLAKEYNHKKFLKRFGGISREYKALQKLARKQTIIEEAIPHEIIQKIASYL